jgi:crotonobetainyl-CoA:carnitine CoA-transferase CaiB-like acyl-CoA transferase
MFTTANSGDDMSGPLAGVRVIDMTSVGMGPYATQILGDMGADVIKVETLDGDVFRHTAPSRSEAMGAPFLNLNRNKRSAAIDLKTEKGREALLRMADHADVLIYNIRPRSMKKLGLGYETLRERNPHLVYCGAYGYSEAGPDAGSPAFDDIIQARSGLAFLQASSETREPAYVNTIIADKVAGLTIAYAVSMALYAREKSGVGQEIEVPMFETLVSFTMIEHLAGESFTPALGPVGYDRVLSSYRKPYRTLDGHLSVLPYTTQQWRRFFEVADRPDLAENERYIRPDQRSRSIGELYGIVEAVIGGRSTDEWYDLLVAADIPVARVNRPEDLFHDAHLAATGFFSQVSHPTEGELKGIGIPVRFSATPGKVRRHAPRLGEHSLEVLLESGFGLEECREMSRQGVFRDPSITEDEA